MDVHGMMVKNSLDNKVLFPGASGKRWGGGGGVSTRKFPWNSLDGYKSHPQKVMIQMCFCTTNFTGKVEWVVHEFSMSFQVQNFKK